MDVDKDMSRYWQALKSQKENLKKAKDREGERPRDRKPRGLAYLQFTMAMAASQAKTQSGKHLITSTFVPPAYFPCTTPLAQLTPTAIKHLRLETHHRGKYLFLSVITPPSRMNAVLALAEDDEDDVVLLQLYQQEAEDVRKATDVISVGTTLVVKEPYYKITAHGDYSLRLDHLSDLVHVDKNDSRIPKAWRPKKAGAEESVELFKSRGDAAVKDRKYWRAIQEYSCAISSGATPERSEVIKRNRSLAYLKTKQFDAALSDTGFPSFDSAPVEKALFRAAEALYDLERFSECGEVLDKLCAKFPNNQQALAILARARSRCSEQQNGAYDFKLLQREAEKIRPPQLDHATYVGPVETRQAAGKGRGMFVTSAVKAGDLLLCEKAFSHAYVSEDGAGNSKTTILMHVETEKGFMGGQADLITLIVQKLRRNPSLAPAFLALHHGAYEPAKESTVDGTPIIDTFLVERIMSLNVFGCPLSSFNTYNDFLKNQSKKETAYHSCGVWNQASYINHSCTRNAHRAFVGDMMIVRATQDLEPGTEITFWYHPPDGTDPEAMQKKLGNWGFACTCAICQDAKEAKATVADKRRKLLNTLLEAFKKSTSHNAKLSEAERLLKSLNDTYTRPAHEVPRILLWDPQLLMTRMYMAQNNMKRALDSVQKVFASLGFIINGLDATSTPFKVVKWGLVVDTLVEAFLHARTAFEAMMAWDDAKRAEAYARCVYKMVVGEDASFEAIYGRVEG
ncbi:hypothetical protein CC86DRAFT_354942 [Ophiobolus disseminans]|uniref:SET domain-containing protein n=1 Tax=Ophiobolus disseminans TaxID=1469910 RepID=A0A6A6ZTQ5_9PLEO|nr:hypothetical protein CC86DRAFT_354942 [Ophiobolus disseminans]